MSNVSFNTTGSFSVNVPQSVLFSSKLVSQEENVSRLEKIEKELEAIFSVEQRLSTVEQIEIYKMQLEMEKIALKYVSTNREMIPLDTLRMSHFKERIDTIYTDNEPSNQDFIKAEALMQEKENLLATFS